MENIIGDYRSFIDDLLQRVKFAGIDIEEYPIDHLCYRTETIENYTEMKSRLMEFSSDYIENIHHNRPISKFILKEPLVCDKYSISLIELPSPKEKIEFKSGLEHLEMVVGDKFETLKEQYKSLWNGSDDSGPYNQPVYITFDNNKTIKFHQYALIDVLKKENKEFIKLA